jgi:tetratricopeptide (TPR) repeat protein
MPKSKRQQKKSFQEYMNAGNEAVGRWSRGDKKGAADKYWEAFDICPDDWEGNRFHILHGYTSILREKYFPPSKEDMKNLKHLVHNEELPKLYRQEAAWTYGLLSWDAGDRAKASDYYREALVINSQADSSERKRKMMHTMEQNGRPVHGLQSVDAILALNKSMVQDNLQVLENPVGASRDPGLATSDLLRSDGTFMSRETRFTRAPNDPSLLARLAVGGNVCDNCGKTWQELGRPRLDCCTRCKNAFYCSKECQKTAWKGGHKQACRQPGQTEIGDVMKLQKLESRPELNNSLVEVLSKDKTEGRWQVRSFVTGASMSIASEKLEHIRPEK